jgi:hypothetical protein
MTAPHAGEAWAIKIEKPNHIAHPCLARLTQVRHTADPTINRVCKQSPRVFNAGADKSGHIILIAFVMAAMPVSLCAAITGASQVSVVESPRRDPIWAVAWLEMLNVAVDRCQNSFAITTKVLLFCL